MATNWTKKKTTSLPVFVAPNFVFVGCTLRVWNKHGRHSPRRCNSNLDGPSPGFTHLDTADLRIRHFSYEDGRIQVKRGRQLQAIYN